MSRDFRSDVGYIERDLRSLEGDLNVKLGTLKAAADEVKDLEGQIEAAGKALDTAQKAIELLTMVQVVVREGARQSFENIITTALNHIIGEDYKFVMAFGRRGNQQEVDFNVQSNSLKLPLDPMDTSGGGVIDIVAFALRVATLELHRPRIDGPILLDETFKHLSQGHLDAAADFMNAVSKKTSRQIIMVSHKQEFVAVADTKIEVKG